MMRRIMACIIIALSINAAMISHASADSYATVNSTSTPSAYYGACWTSGGIAGQAKVTINQTSWYKVFHRLWPHPLSYAPYILKSSEWIGQLTPGVYGTGTGTEYVAPWYNSVSWMPNSSWTTLQPNQVYAPPPGHTTYHDLVVQRGPSASGPWTDSAEWYNTFGMVNC